MVEIKNPRTLQNPVVILFVNNRLTANSFETFTQYICNEKHCVNLIDTSIDLFIDI